MSSAAVTQAPPVNPAAANVDIAKAARLTLVSMQQGMSIGMFALKHRHLPAPNSKEIAFTVNGVCYYGPRFAQMDRPSQTFVVAHETLHNVLAHPQQGAILYKRYGKNFHFRTFNIAADAIINYCLERLPDVDKLAGTVKYGVRQCQEFGIVNWHKLVAMLAAACREEGLALDPIFDKTPDQLTAIQIYHALRATFTQIFEARGEQTPEEIADNVADANGAHDDLDGAIMDAATKKSESELQDHVRSQSDILKRTQAGARPGDALLAVKAPDEFSNTPWYAALRRYTNSALLPRAWRDPYRPSRKMLSQISHIRHPGIRVDRRERGVVAEPLMRRQVEAKRCTTIIDTSSSIVTDAKLLASILTEVRTICRNVQTTQTIIFADAGVCSIVPVEDSLAKISELKPLGGGGTDFRPALALAETLNPDLIVYITDLYGRFPDQAPSAPVVWAFPPSSDGVPTPFGQRVPLHI